MNPSSLWFTNKGEWFRQNYGIVWITNCWNGFFDVSKPHQKGKVLYSNCSLCHVSLLTSAQEKSGGKGPVLQWLKNQSEESEMCHYCYMIIELMLNLLIFVKINQGGKFQSVPFILKASREMVLCL